MVAPEDDGALVPTQTTTQAPAPSLFNHIVSASPTERLTDEEDVAPAPFYIVSPSPTEVNTASVENSGMTLFTMCAIYGAAYPTGHTDEDLSTPIFSMLPDDAVSEVSGASDITTQEFLAVYEGQHDFCIETESLWAQVLEEVKSGEELSDESAELLEIAVYEVAAVLNAHSQTRRRRLENTIASLAVLLGVAAVSAMSTQCSKRRRALAAPKSGSRLLQQELENSASRRALQAATCGDHTIEENCLSSVGCVWDDGVCNGSNDDSPWQYDTTLWDITDTIQMTDIGLGCNGGIPSFVCNMTFNDMMALHTSQICGSSGLFDCTFNMVFALDYTGGLL